MKQKRHPGVPTASNAEFTHADQFVERMFSGFGQSLELPVRGQRPPEQPFQPLRASKASPGIAYRLQTRTPAVRVQADSPAIDVMTDLSRVPAVTIRSDVALHQARQTMVAHGVRALFVVDEQNIVLGIITSTDILGEKPIKVAQQRSIRHDEIRVSEVMTPADSLEALELRDVMHSLVGDVVASLKLSGRQHALVIDSASADATSPAVIRGIFSLTQIARQLGLPPQAEHDVARTFAQIEAEIGA